MKIRIQVLFTLIASYSFVFAQNHTLSGLIKDNDTGEPLIGASVLVGTSGTTTELDGTFALKLPKGNYKVTFSYAGYNPVDRTINLDKDLRFEIGLSPVVLKEVLVTADIAKDRETPVAFSNIPSVKIKEELASQDLPMILNSTPGAYATRSGGGDGDARITIRGFNQRNVAVMLDGIPVNDMENGWVYWSNWFGLDLVTQTMQIQRGLGASKLSIPSVGGTLNILTKGIDANKSLDMQQEVGNNGFVRTTLAYTSGRLKHGWGISAALSYKQGDGWVDATYTKGYFYYLRIDKQLGRHLISLSGFGAPQSHGQRSFLTPISVTDVAYARELGIPEENIQNKNNYLGIDRGLRFNQHWGYLDGQKFNTNINYFHKPQYSLRHSWQPNNRFYWSNVAYLSIGDGGGTSLGGSSISQVQYYKNGQIYLDTIVQQNQKAAFLKPAGQSLRVIRSSINNHFWYGLLSTVKYNVNRDITLSAGIDARYYRGDHWREVYDLLGGKYFIGFGNSNIDNSKTQLKVGDKYEYNYSGFVRWGGLFGLAEYKRGKLSAFLNGSLAYTAYRLEDYFKPKRVTLADTSFLVTIEKPVTYKGTTYSAASPEAKTQVVDWVVIPSVTIKTGASYAVNSDLTVFTNLGYIDKAQRFNNVIYNNRAGNEISKAFNYENEKIQSIELGLNYRTPLYSANLNFYYTNWLNKPLDNPVRIANPNDPQDIVPINVPGIDAIHKGIEFDFAFRPLRSLTIEGLVSVGDWRWNSSDTVNVFYGDQIFKYPIYTKGVHVGDAAQVQLGGMVRYEPIKGLYIKLKGTYFGKNYANFNPETLQDPNNILDSWKLPGYTIIDLHTGYNFKVRNTRMGLRFNVLNLLDAVYISDAQNNDTRAPGISTQTSDARSASVFFGLGRQWNVSLQIGI